jgi:ABC-type phosphate/phosphonate transport system substrate-binding protein
LDVLDRPKSTHVDLTQPVSLPMYALPEMQAANSAFLAALRRRLRVKGLDIAGAASGSNHGAVLEGSRPGVLFTQMCGYPLFKHSRNQYRMLATPHYALPGCVEFRHRAFFMVRGDDPAECLDDLRGRVFGSNSLSSNTGMNLPRLSLARIAGGKRFFYSVVITGAHVTSLQYLAKRAIDVCSIDNVTWGLFRKFYPVAAEQYRILDQTASSPCPPFVTSIDRTESEVKALGEALDETMNDPELSHMRKVLELTELSVPEIDAYEQLAQYEREAAELDFPEIR